MQRIEIRPFAARDSFEALTRLLHLGYAPLAAAGIDLAASTQSAATTARRAAEGQCFVAESAGQIVGTVTVCGPYSAAETQWASAPREFRERDTAHFHQFAVHPALQGQGLGRRLVACAERWALQHGYRHMVIEAAEPAEELCALYAHLGYAETARVAWPGLRHRSLIMRKALDRSPLRDQLQMLARYNLWATRRLYEQVDDLSEADYRRAAGLFFGSVHGTLNHLLVGEHLLWRVRFAEGHSPKLALDAEAEPDRARLRERLVEGALAWLPLIEVWPEARLHGRLEYRSTSGREMNLPFAATLTHVFNHGSHHRGQITAALTAMGRPCPELDLVAMLQQEA
ncbi:MAG: GNAT family N-acetyltransferase [Burkholderiales bacterium]|nr:GNAT family N-acetyltransferase [Burkholderiales bacterium]MDE2395336.1 GNAT family N-acetyltransferase [Burkholderiales bacterium]MDE2452443.1 GNAT family N-acetyltransferase [Burkholderiales bacterium]